MSKTELTFLYLFIYHLYKDKKTKPKEQTLKFMILIKLRSKYSINMIK